MLDPGTFPGAVATVAPCCHTINDRGQVVGFWFDAMGNVRAFLWQDSVLTDLNDLIPEGSPWQLLFAEAINDAERSWGKA